VKQRGNKVCHTKNNVRTATLQGRPVELFSIRKEVEIQFLRREYEGQPDVAVRHREK
jgi:hypothetical protein